MDFILVEASLQGLSFNQELKGRFSREEALEPINSARAVAKKALYHYAPVDYGAIAELSKKNSRCVKDMASLAGAVASTKPSDLESALLPFVKDDRPQEYLVEKKCDSALHIAICCYFSGLYEKLFPLPQPPSSKAVQPGFRFAANFDGWVLVRKTSAKAEKKEVFACLVAAAETLDRKSVQLSVGGQEFLQKLDAFLSARPSRRSVGKIPSMLKELASSDILPDVSKQCEEYAVAKVFSSCGYAPYCSVDLVNGVYPELKIPKPRGRLKKD